MKQLASGPFYAVTGLRVFFALLLFILLTSQQLSKLFLSSHGRSHRILGALHLSWLLYGATFLINPDDKGSISSDRLLHCILYDIILGLLGVLTTLSAAKDFPHRYVSNRPGESGTLSRSAMVTQSEMIEHSFYQGLNLWQALYLHAITWLGGESIRTSLLGKYSALWLVTVPWALRRFFPVHSFSANWTNTDPVKCNIKNNVKKMVMAERKEKASKPINRMYQMKKWQYVFYKHVILHGLNISVVFPKASSHIDIYNPPLPANHSWRVFWLGLNTSYVMEFFLQSLVKREVLSQQTMIFMQWILMISSSFAAIGAVLGIVRFEIATISVFLNFINRKHDIVNTMASGLIAVALSKQFNM